MLKLLELIAAAVLAGKKPEPSAIYRDRQYGFISTDLGRTPSLLTWKELYGCRTISNWPPNATQASEGLGGKTCHLTSEHWYSKPQFNQVTPNA